MPDAITSIHLGESPEEAALPAARRRAHSGGAGVAGRLESGMDAAALRARGVHREVRPALRAAARRAWRAALLPRARAAGLGRRHAGDLSAQQPLGGRRQPSRRAVLRLGRARRDRHRQPGQRRGSQPVLGNGADSRSGPGHPGAGDCRKRHPHRRGSAGIWRGLRNHRTGKARRADRRARPGRRGRCGRISGERHQAGRR